MEIKHLDVVLCEFYFSDFNKSKKRPVLVFKDNLPFDDFVAIPISSKIEKLQNSVVKKYGTLSEKSYEKFHNLFCLYFGCNNEQKQ